MKLKSALRSLSTDALEDINRFWSLPLPAQEGAQLDQDQWIEHLYPRLQNPAHFRNAFDRLSEFERHLLHFLAIHGGNLDVKELRKRCFMKPRGRSDGDESAPEMKEVLERMARRGFLFEERWPDPADEAKGTIRISGIPEPYLRFIELPHFWQGYLGGLLRDVPTEQLVRIATNGLALKVSSGKRDALQYAIRRALADPDLLRKYIDSLPEDQREALFLILQRRGVCLYRELLDILQERSGNLVRGESVERLLASSGLLFLATSNPTKHDNLLRVPRDVYYMITHHFVQDLRGLDSLDTINKVEANQQPKIILDNGISILRDLVIFVGYVARHGVRRLGNGGIGKNDLRKALSRLSANKTLKYAQFLAFYAVWRKFLVPTGDAWAISAGFEERLHDSRAFYIDLYTSWFESSEWNEEFVDGDCQHTDNYPANLIHIVELRKLVLDNLARIPFDTWIDGPRFIESLLAQIEVRIPHRGGKAHVDKHNRINYLVIESVLCESLHWLGLISLGLHEKTDYSQLGNRKLAEPADANGSGANGNGRLDKHFNFNPRPLLPETYSFHFQINGLGRSILSASADNPSKLLDPKISIALPFRDDMVHFTVLPNLDVVAPPDLNLAHFFKLRKFSVIRHIDVMSILAITQNSLRAGMDSGLTGEEILGFLQTSCPNGLPETVRHLIRECTNRYGEISVGYAGGFIRVDDPVLMEDLKSNKVLSTYVKDVVGRSVIILNRDADIQQVSRELHRLGFLPTVDNENVYSTQEGRLRFSLKRDDFGVLMAILQFVLAAEKAIGSTLTEDRTRPLLHALRPANHAYLNVGHFADVLCKQFEKNFDEALQRKINGIANKYRKQMRGFLAQRGAPKGAFAYPGINPATADAEIRKMLRFAADQDRTVQLRYTNASKEEIVETVRPESLDGDKLYAFSEETQSYCAYRIARILSTRLD